MTKKEQGRLISKFKQYKKVICTLLDCTKIPGAGELFVDFVDHPEKYSKERRS